MVSPVGLCTGVLISCSAVLTAKHCIQNKKSEEFNQEDLIILLGYNIGQNSSTSGNKATVIRGKNGTIKVKNPGKHHSKVGDDIAVIELERDIDILQYDQLELK